MTPRLFSIEHAPVSLPIWHTMMDDLCQPPPARVARVLGISIRSVYRATDDQGPPPSQQPMLAGLVDHICNHAEVAGQRQFEQLVQASVLDCAQPFSLSRRALAMNDKPRLTAPAPKARKLRPSTTKVSHSRDSTSRWNSVFIRIRSVVNASLVDPAVQKSEAQRFAYGGQDLEQVVDILAELAAWRNRPAVLFVQLARRG